MNITLAVPSTEGCRLTAPAGVISLLLLSFTWAQAQVTASFDFDNNLPVLGKYQTIDVAHPVSQTDPFSLSALSATFSSPEGFSVQDSASTGLTISAFSGKYLVSNHNDTTTLNHLNISFDQPLTYFSAMFATADATQVENPTKLQLSAYSNTTWVGSVMVPASYANVVPNGPDSKPTALIEFTSLTPFNMVELVAPIQVGGTLGYMVDNISVTVVPEPSAYALATGLGLLGFAFWRQHKAGRPAAA